MSGDEIDANKRKALEAITKRALCTPMSISLLQTPEIGTIDEKFVWKVKLPFEKKLLEQDSDTYVLKSLRGGMLEMEIPGYRILNALKKAGQKSYGAEYLDDFFLFDWIDGISNDRSHQLMKKPDFYTEYVKQVAAACAKAYAIGFSDQYAPILIIDEKEMPCDYRWIDLTSSFAYPRNSWELDCINGFLTRVIKEGKEHNYSGKVDEIAFEFYLAFSQEIRRIMGIDKAFLTTACDNAQHLVEGTDRRKRFFGRLDPAKTDIDELVKNLQRLPIRY